MSKESAELEALREILLVYQTIDWRFTDGKAVGKIEVELTYWGRLDSLKKKLCQEKETRVRRNFG